MDRIRERQPAGTPIGGRFAPRSGDAPDIELEPAHAPDEPTTLTYSQIERRSIEQARRQRRFLASELREQFFVGRLIDRVFTEPPIDDVHWILKGGLRQLAASRLARHTSDGDLYADIPLDEAITSLAACGQRDVGDGITYTIASIERYDDHPHAADITLAVHMHGRQVTTVNVDVSTKIRMAGTPRQLKPVNPLDLDLDQPAGYRTYHPADQIADKVAATFELTPRGPSQRYRDLVDIELISMSDGMTADVLRRSLELEFTARNIPMPSRFTVPDHGAWSNGYEQIVSNIEGLRSRRYADGFAAVAAFLDPVLDGSADGQRWDRRSGRWVDG